MSDITVHITSSLTNSERRISTGWSFKYLKQRIETITGIPPEDQQLLLFTTPISTESVELNTKGASEEEVFVSQLQITASSRIHVNDTRPISNLKDLEDDSNAKKFELKEEDYDKRTDSVRQWKRDNKLGRFDPNFEIKKAEARELNETKVKELTIGSRFRTVNDSNGERRGVIRYIGKVQPIDNENVWVGVEFDEPVGKNDGSIKSERFFKAKPNYGSFLKPIQIEQGDFPEKDLFSDDDDEI